MFTIEQRLQIKLNIKLGGRHIHKKILNYIHGDLLVDKIYVFANDSLYTNPFYTFSGKQIEVDCTSMLDLKGNRCSADEIVIVRKSLY